MPTKNLVHRGGNKMGSCCVKEVRGNPGSSRPSSRPRNPTRVQGGSRVYIRAQDPSVKLALKMIHLPQEIRSGPPPGRDTAETSVQKTLIRNDSTVMSDRESATVEAGSVQLEDGQVAYMPQSFAPEPRTARNGDAMRNVRSGGWNVDNKQISQYKLGYGPRTDDAIVELINMNISHVPPTEGNDYLYDPETHPAEFDAINTLVTSQLLINLTRRCLWENGEKEVPAWRWGRDPITVYPYAFKVPTAYYKVEPSGDIPGELQFGYFKQGDETLFFCRSFDAIAHETGHAILDGIKPSIVSEGLLEGLALTESFADLAAVFGVLDQVDLCEAILLQSKGDLHNKNFLPIIVDSYGPQGIRNIDHDLKVSEVEEEPHSLSLVMTGAIYDVIADTFNHKALRSDLSTDAQILSDIGRHLFGVTLLAFKKSPDLKTKMRDVVRAMMVIEKDDFIRDAMHKQFERRELMDLHMRPRPRVRPELPLTAGCCETLKNLYKTDEPRYPPNASIVPVQP